MAASSRGTGPRAQEPFTAPDLTGGVAAGGAAAAAAGPIGTAAASRATVAEAVPYERSTPSRGAPADCREWPGWRS